MCACACVPGLLDMLTRAQCSRVDDQRGLLTKEQLELPSFLQLSLEQGPHPELEETSTACTADSSEETTPSSSNPPADAAEKPPDSAQSVAKDLRETAV